MKNSGFGEMMMGMAAGAVIGAAGMVLMDQNHRQMKRTMRKIGRGAEHTMAQLDRLVTEFVDNRK